MNLQGARVVIVEGFVAMDAELMVEGLGGRVAGTARSLLAAKEKIRQANPDCVLLDVNLNGELSRGIAAELEERAIPFVFCTAYVHRLDGFEHIPRVMKPYCESDLMRELNAVPEGKAS